MDDPWAGLTHYIVEAISFGPGSLGAVAGTIEITDEMAATNARGDEAIEALVKQARRAGVLRDDLTSIDLSLLIEQLAKSPLLEQLTRQGRTDLTEEAMNARARITAIALAGIRAPAREPLPGTPPGYELFSERWARNSRTT